MKETFDEVKEEIRASVGELKAKLNALEEENKKLIETTLRLERKVRKNNVAIFGIGENETDLIQTVSKIFIKNVEVEINKEDISDAYRIGNIKNKKLPVIVEFVSYQKKLTVLKNAKKLKGSRISITPDLCFEDRKERKILIKHLKNARIKGANAYLKGGKLYVAEKAYTAQDLEKELELEEEEQTQETSYRNPHETKINTQSKISPKIQDSCILDKRQLGEEKEKENCYNRKKTKEKGKFSKKTKSASFTNRICSNLRLN